MERLSAWARRVHGGWGRPDGPHSALSRGLAETCVRIEHTVRVEQDGDQQEGGGDEDRRARLSPRAPSS